MRLLLYFLVIFYTFIVSALTYGKINSPKRINKIQAIRLYDCSNNQFLSLSNTSDYYIPIQDIPKDSLALFVLIEDKNFFSHSGYDLPRIIKATYNNLLNNGLEGASTITQQFARNQYLSNEKTFKRKFLELYYSSRIERHYTKNEILEGYLNTLYFGHGQYGICKAAYYYFQTSANNLTISQTTSLLAIVNNPTYYSPITNYQNFQSKRKQILNKALLQEVITIEEYNIAINDNTQITPIPIKSNSGALFYRDLLLIELESLGFYNNDKYPNLKIETGYNPKLNPILPNNEGQISIVALNPDGLVSSIIGSKNYYESSYNRALHSKRQLGSTVKPFLYYQALACGISPLAEFRSCKTTFTYNNEKYTPQNYNNSYEDHNISMLYALATSDNIYALKMHKYLGLSSLAKLLDKVGISATANLSLALGTTDATLLDITNAYNCFSSFGQKTIPHLIDKIYSNDKLIYKYSHKNNQLLNKADVYIINELLTNTFDTTLNGKNKVTGQSISHLLSHKYAAKSGSTDHDNWIVGFNPYICLGIWSGFDEYSPSNSFSTGYNIKNIWAHLMEDYMIDKKDKWYLLPNNVILKYVNPSGLDTKYKKWVPFRNPLPYYL